MQHLPQTPIISVVIPTYKRRPQVETAIRSVQDQTYTAWELIVTDDEKPSGETWRYLQELAATDARIRPTRQTAGQGQAANTNHGMAQARGEWIKLLHDDDRLMPNCLSQLAHVAQLVDEQVVLITTGICIPGQLRRQQVATLQPNEVRRYRGNEALFGMYLQDEVGGAIPSSMMVRAMAFHKGIHFEKEDALPIAVDSWFKARLLTLGDMVHIDQPLIIKYSNVPSITTTVTEQQLDRDYELIRQMIRPLLDAQLTPPPLKVAQGQVRLIRAMHRLRRGHPVQALTLAGSVAHPWSWWLALGWAVRKVRPGWWRHVKDVGSPLE